MRILAVAAVAAACGTTSSRRSIKPAPKPVSIPSPFDALGSNVADAFSGTNLLFHVTAVGATGVMAQSGADHEAHLHFGRRASSGGWNSAANIAGYVVPAVTGPTLWLVGTASRNRRIAGAGSAAIQAVLVTMATTGALKLAVGRPYPELVESLDDEDNARDFRPFRGGLGSWPSGHTSSAISLAAALTAYAPDEHWIPLIGYPVALGIGLGMVDRDSHWASDLVAGALIGHAIGFSIGRNFRKRVNGEVSAPDELEVVPVGVAGGAGVGLAGSW